VLPLGIFLAEHIVLNAKALRGQDAYLRTTHFVDSVPGWAVLEVLLVFAPLLFHAGYGLVLMLTKSNGGPSPYAPSWAVLNRGAAWVAFVFIAYHVYAVRMARWTQGVGPDALPTMFIEHISTATGSAGGLQMPWTAMFYLVGIAATVVHFSVGTWGYLVRFKLVATARGTRRAAMASGAIGVLLFSMASTTTISLATGSPLFPPSRAPALCPPNPQK
jgi:succinate dehydrogenase / fumarate reductase cytochrome b subunit